MGARVRIGHLPKRFRNRAGLDGPDLPTGAGELVPLLRTRGAKRMGGLKAGAGGGDEGVRQRRKGG